MPSCSPRESVYVATGAALGGVLRHIITRGSSTPRRALVRVAAVNLAGSFAFGTVSAASKNGILSSNMGAALSAGFCGGLTTFSSFVGGVWEEGRTGAWCWAIGYVTFSCLLGVGGVAGGHQVVRNLQKWTKSR